MCTRNVFFLWCPADDYDPALDHVTNSPEVAIAVCEAVSSLVTLSAGKATADFNKKGPFLFMKILAAHWGLPDTAVVVCRAISLVVAQQQAYAKDFDAGSAPYELLKCAQLNFWHEACVAACMRALVDIAGAQWIEQSTLGSGGYQSSTALETVAKTKGALALRIRVTEAYRARSPEILEIMSSLYGLYRATEPQDIKEARKAVRTMLIRTVREGKGMHYLHMWDSALAQGRGAQPLSLEQFKESLKD